MPNLLCAYTHVCDAPLKSGAKRLSQVFVLYFCSLAATLFYCLPLFSIHYCIHIHATPEYPTLLHDSASCQSSLPIITAGGAVTAFPGAVIALMLGTFTLNSQRRHRTTLVCFN
jgi:hypothetical protein